MTQKKSRNLSDLADILFSQIEEVKKTDVKDENFKEKIQKANTIQKLSDSFLKDAEIVMQGAVIMHKFEQAGEKINSDLPKLLGAKREDEEQTDA